MVSKPDELWVPVWEERVGPLRYGVRVVRSPLAPEHDLYESYFSVWGRPPIGHLTLGQPLTKAEVSERFRQMMDEDMREIQRFRQEAARHFGWH